MSHKKKIVFKLEEFPHLSETFILAQMITAVNLGYEINILTGKLLDINESSYAHLLDEYQFTDKIIVEDYKIPKNKLIRVSKWLVLLMAHCTKLKSIIGFYSENKKWSLTWLYQWHFYNQFKNASIFHIQYGTNSKPLDILKKTGFKPSVIVTFHGHDAFFPINGFIPNDHYYDNLFKFGNLITANTPYLAEKIFELGCPRELLTIIPVGVDNTYFHPNVKLKKSDKPLKLITVGRLDKVKGHKFCIEAVNVLINQNLDVTLTIIGEGPERANLENLISEYKMQDRVFLKGKNSQSQIRAELWCHDVYLLAAVPLADGRRETQGLATLEAEACGLPAIVFDSGGVRYTVDEGKSGFVVEEYDIAGLTEKIILLYADPDLRTTMGANAVNFVNQNFSQAHIDKIWSKHYTKLSLL